MGGTHGDTPANVIQLETTVDDMTGQEIGYLWDKVFEAGALDMYLTAIQMKAGRCGQRITVLTEISIWMRYAAPSSVIAPPLACFAVGRNDLSMDRTITREETPFGTVRVRYSQGYGAAKSKAMEFEDLKAIANANHMSLNEVEAVVEQQKIIIKAKKLSFRIKGENSE